MKKLTFLLVAICLSTIIQAAVTKSVNCTTPGTLRTYFTIGERTTVTDLTVSGTIDARDFKFMRDTLTALTKVDISTINIAEYTGAGGTYTTSVYTYAEKTLPQKSFFNKSNIVSITLPTSIITIQGSAFANCTSLVSIIIPASVTTIYTGLFSGCFSMSDIQFNNPTPTSLSVIPGADGNLIIGLFGQACNIWVPEGSRSSYNAGVEYGGWNFWSYNNYQVLEGSILTSVQQPFNNNLNISTQGYKAIVTGLTIGDSLDVYTLHGEGIYSTVVDNVTMVVNLPMHGVYIVKVGNQLIKIVL